MRRIVIIELKTGTTRQKAVVQILSYMGDVAEEESDATVRGILVVVDFDKKAPPATQVVPTLSSRFYRINFEFMNAGDASGVC